MIDIPLRFRHFQDTNARNETYSRATKRSIVSIEFLNMENGKTLREEEQKRSV